MRSEGANPIGAGDQTMMSEPQDMTLDELRARIRVAGITIAEKRLSMVRKLLGEALAPVRALDSRTLRTVEPAVTFALSREIRDE